MALVRSLTCLAALALSIVAVAAQEKRITTADFAGTWNIEVMSHQVALVVEPAEGNKVTATMMAMGRDTLLKGELTDRTLTLVGLKTVDSGHAFAGGDHSHPGDKTPAANAKPIVVTLQEDGSITGEMMTNNGPVKWTGEKLRAKKKG